jgi:transposase
VACEVIAPTLVPTKPGDRVKTDRRDAEKLARCYRAGELTPVWVPADDHEALRDLVRAREAAKKDQLKARHRLGKFLLRHGQRPEGLKAWTKKHLEWIKSHVRFKQAALEVTTHQSRPSNGGRCRNGARRQGFAPPRQATARP